MNGPDAALHRDILVTLASRKDETGRLALQAFLDLLEHPEDFADGGEMPEQARKEFQDGLIQDAYSMCDMAVRNLEGGLPKLSAGLALIALQYEGPDVSLPLKGALTTILKVAVHEAGIFDQVAKLLQPNIDDAVVASLVHCGPSMRELLAKRAPSAGQNAGSSIADLVFRLKAIDILFHSEDAAHVRHVASSGIDWDAFYVDSVEQLKSVALAGRPSEVPTSVEGLIFWSNGNNVHAKKAQAALDELQGHGNPELKVQIAKAATDWVARANASLAPGQIPMHANKQTREYASGQSGSANISPVQKQVGGQPPAAAGASREDRERIAGCMRSLTESPSKGAAAMMIDLATSDGGLGNAAIDAIEFLKKKYTGANAREVLRALALAAFERLGGHVDTNAEPQLNRNMAVLAALANNHFSYDPNDVMYL